MASAGVAKARLRNALFFFIIGVLGQACCQAGVFPETIDPGGVFLTTDSELDSLRGRIAELEAEIAVLRDEKRNAFEQEMAGLLSAHLPVAVLVCTVRGERIFSNTVWQTLFQEEEGDNFSFVSNVYHIIKDQQDQGEDTACNSEQQSNSCCRYETHYPKKDNTICWLDVHVSQISGPVSARAVQEEVARQLPGQAMGELPEHIPQQIHDSQRGEGYIIYAVTDISERKRVEIALRIADQEKAMIFDTIDDGIIYQDVDHRVIWANTFACRGAGRELSEVRGQYCYTVWRNRTEVCDQCPVKEAAVHNTVREGEIELADGLLWWVKGVPLHNEQGEVTGVIEVARDITARKKVEQELKKARDGAEKANRMKNDFLANMSHELRSPLNGVLGMLDLVLDTDLDRTQRKNITTALTAGEGLLEIINDILDFSKLQAYKVTLAKTSYELRRTIQNVLETFTEQSIRSKIPVSCQISRAVPKSIVGDEARIRQILFNIIDNALKFTHQGKVTLTVAVARRLQHNKIQLFFSVEDTGIGIAKEDIHHIFDPFTQLNWEKSRKYEGTGLGLGIVQRLVHLMNGSITIQSEPGKGTNVQFWIESAMQEGQEAVYEEETVFSLPCGENEE